MRLCSGRSLALDWATMSTHTSSKPSPSASGQDSRDNQWATLCVVVTTVDSAEAAEDMARAIVSGKAAACVQAERINSCYMWDGVLQNTPEWRLIFKTLPDALPRLTRLIHEQHSYEVPQITMRTERCLQDYAKWLKAQIQT